MPDIEGESSATPADNRRIPADQGGSTPENVRKIAGAPDYARLRPITPDPDKLPVEEARILLYLLDYGQISRKDTMSLLGLGETKVKALFVALAGRKLIVRRGQGRSTCYVLAQKP
jgi:ATP-dependent DNA helicase RecG